MSEYTSVVGNALRQVNTRVTILYIIVVVHITLDLFK